MKQAEIAQLVEHFTRNEGVVGSSPIFSFIHQSPQQLLLSGAFLYFMMVAFITFDFLPLYILLPNASTTHGRICI